MLPDHYEKSNIFQHVQHKYYPCSSLKAPDICGFGIFLHSYGNLSKNYTKLSFFALIE